MEEVWAGSTVNTLTTSAECVVPRLAKKSCAGESSQWLSNLNLTKVPDIRKHERFTSLLSSPSTKATIQCNGS